MVNQETKSTNITIIVISIIIVFGSWIFTFYTLRDLSYDNRSSFGDMFGGLNAFFSGLAFAGIVYTIYLQRETLKLQQQELKDTREELERAANAQEKSQEALNNQLKSMELSSKIDNLFKFIEIERGEEEKYVAQQIIKDLTRRIFHLEEHGELLKPSLESRSEPFRTKPSSEEQYQYRMVIGPTYLSLKLLEVRIMGEIENWIHNPRDMEKEIIGSSSSMIIEFKSSRTLFVFQFKFSSPITKRIYVQDIRYFVDEKNNLVEIIGSAVSESVINSIKF